MSKDASILLGDYYKNYVKEKVDGGQFSTVSEVLRNALRLMEQHEKEIDFLNSELSKGENSGFSSNFQRDINLERLNNSVH